MDERCERQDEVRVFGLNRGLSPHLLNVVIDTGDDRIVQQIQRGLIRELLASMDRQGYEVVSLGQVDARLVRDAFVVEPRRRTWWEWLLRRPQEVPKPMHVLRVTARGVPKGRMR